MFHTPIPRVGSNILNLPLQIHFVRSFLKMFLAALLALLVFCGFLLLFLTVATAGLVSGKDTEVPSRSVLYLDLSRSFRDRKVMDPLTELTGSQEDQVPTLYELTRMIRHAKRDSAIRGIYIKADGNANSFAASEEIRMALMDFRRSGKWVLSYGDNITQEAYYVASAGTRVYGHPKGSFDWTGLSVEYVFFKKALDRLEVKPQIFYDGKFKSATEPFRAEKMTEENRLQTTVWLGDLYARMLHGTAESRNLDSAQLRRYANEFTITSPDDAVKFRLLDGVRYDDQVRDEIRKQLGIGAREKIHFVMPGTYRQRISLVRHGKAKIPIVYAEGDIIDGKGEEGEVGGDTYRALLRKLREDDDVKAIVLRVNSPGGSSLASETLWRELSLFRQSGKPVVVSMGDVAASGGYYISCMADSIFALPNTITGSIGVFSIVPDLEGLFRNKLGVTFDRVSTSPYADAASVTRPMTEQEKKIMQNQVDRIYADFKRRVADGRKKDTRYIDSIAQGRVWTGVRAKEIGLVDRLGNLDDAIRSAASLARLTEYSVREYPEPRSALETLFRSTTGSTGSAMEKELGREGYTLYKRLRQLKGSAGVVQARLPFEFSLR
jgi:protease IV